VTYTQEQSGVFAHDVGLALTANYRPTPAAGTYGNHLRVCVLHALEQDTPSQYATAISDLAVTVEEVQGSPAGETRFEVRDADQIKGDGRTVLTTLIPQWAATLTQQTITYGVGTVHPIFSVFANTWFDHAGGSSYEGAKDHRELVLRDTKKWSFRKWHRKPGSLVLGVDTGYLSLGTTTGGSVSGPVDYELSVTATTGERLHSPRGRLIQPTGTVTDKVSFTVDWQ